MTIPDTIDTAPTPPPGIPWYRSKKMWIAVPISLVLIGMNLVIYQPAAAIAGMLTDSCSGDSTNAYLMWEVWLWYLWPVVMVICSLFPGYLILKNKAWWKAALGVVASEVVIIIWYFLWLPILRITGC